MVFPAPGGPTSSRLCPPAQATSSARRARSWPRTSARSGPLGSESRAGGAGWPAAVTGGGWLRAATASVSDDTGRIDNPPTTAASPAFALGMEEARQPLAPGGGCDGEDAPRRLDAAVQRQLAEDDHVGDVAALDGPLGGEIPSAIGRSNAAPALRTSAGARLTVIRWGGKSKPEFLMALRTRSRLSRTLASGNPTIVNAGRPNETSTSTLTAQASMPNTAAVRRLASTIESPMQVARPVTPGGCSATCRFEARRCRRNRHAVPRLMWTGLNTPAPDADGQPSLRGSPN